MKSVEQVVEVEVLKRVFVVAKALVLLELKWPSSRVVCELGFELVVEVVVVVSFQMIVGSGC